MFYTYVHSKPQGSIFYVGKGTKGRAWDLSDKKRNVHWQRTVRKYGCEVQILSYWKTEQEAFDHERFLIDCFKSMNHPLVNLTDGGEGSGGYRWTAEQKAKIDNKAENNSMYGKKHTEQTKLKISIKAKSRSLSQDHKQKIKEKLEGRSFSVEHKHKLSMAGKGGKNSAAKRCQVHGVIYDCGSDAAKALNVSKFIISKRCRSEKHPEYFYL